MYDFTSTELEYFLALEQGIKDIEANPEHWDQSEWHCGTSHCLAGFCDIRRAGFINKLQYSYDDEFVSSPFARQYPRYGCDARIFNSGNTLEDLHMYLEYIREFGFSQNDKLTR